MPRRSMLKDGRSELHKCGSHAGCSCCNSPAVRRVSTHAARQRERRAWQADYKNQDGNQT